MDHPRTSAIPPPPPFRVSADALVCRAIHGSSPDKCNTPPPPLQSIGGCPSMSGHPWIIPGQVQYPHPPFQSIHGCPSMSGHPWIIPGQVQYPPPFRVSADALVCRAIHDPWIIPGQVQYPHPPFQSIHGCPSMSGHPWIIPGQVQYPHPLSESTDALVCRAIHGSSPDKCNTPPPPLSEYPRMP